jgi:hypothetical protein
MPPVPLRLTWRTRLRWLALVALTLSVGLVALTAGVLWFARLACGLFFLAGTALVLDAMVYVRTWEVDGRRWWIPSLWARARIIPVDDQRVVEVVGTLPARFRITGSKGSRDVLLSPVLSRHDVDLWFDRIAA